MSQVSEPLKQQYDAFYDGESEWRRLGAAGKVDNIELLCRDIPHNRILDIGAGEGAVLQELAARNFGQERYALDISESGIAAIRARNIPGLREAKVYNGYDIPHGDGTFDLAILSHVVEHLEHPRKLLAEAVRVAKAVFIEVPLEHTLDLGDYVEDGVGHINAFDRVTVRRLAQTSGLRVVRDRITLPSLAQHTFHAGKKGWIKYAVKRAGLALCPPLAARLWCYYYAMLCQKADA